MIYIENWKEGEAEAVKQTKDCTALYGLRPETDRQTDRSKKEKVRERQRGREGHQYITEMDVGLSRFRKKEQNQENNKPAASAVLIKS